MVEHNGVVFRHSDVEDLREKLQLLCDNAGLVRKHQQEAADYICGKYSWDDVVTETIGLYR